MMLRPVSYTTALGRKRYTLYFYVYKLVKNDDKSSIL